MKIWILLFCGLLTAAGAFAVPAAGRFSEGLADAERKTCGIDVLSSDQVAVLNALVRREALVSFSEAPAAKPFSQRLASDEFRAAGLGRLTPVQLAQLDFLFGASLNHPESTAAGAIPPAAALPPPALAASSVTERAPPEIHGLISLGYGWGGGASVRTEETALEYIDPTHHFELNASYSAAQAKGP
jgi:hypothetical protein